MTLRKRRTEILLLCAHLPLLDFLDLALNVAHYFGAAVSRATNFTLLPLKMLNCTSFLGV